MNNLKEIINSLGIIRSELGMDFSDEVIFDNAVKIFISNNIQNEKKDFKNNFKSINQPASEKQKDLLKKINKGIVPAGISMLEAKKLIEEILKKEDKYGSHKNRMSRVS